MIPWMISEAEEPLPAAAEDWFDDGAVPDTWTLTRSAAALGRNSAGRWTSYAANVPRPYHDPQTLAYRGILIEPLRTQLILRSRSSAGLVGVAANASTISTDAAAQTPFGLGATKIVPTTASAQHGTNLSVTGIGDNSSASFQAYMKPIGAYRRGEFFLLNRTNVYSAFAFAMEGAGTIISSTGSVTNVTITPDVDGYFLLKWSMAYGAGTATPTCNLLIEPDTGARTHAGDGTSGFHLAYLGAEIGLESTSPILSDGTVTVTRPADTLTGATELVGIPRKSIGIQYTPLSLSTQVIAHAGSTDTLELRNTGQAVIYVTTTGGAVVAQINGAAPAPGVERTVIVTAALDEFRLAQDGAELGIDIDGPAPMSFSAWRVGGAADGSGTGPMILRRLKVWNQPLGTDAGKSFSSDLSQAGEVVLLPTLDLQSTYTVTPSQTTMTLQVSSADVVGGARVQWRTIDGTAIAGQDYVGDTGEAIIAPGESTASIAITLTTRSNSEDRTFTVELLNPTDATIGNARCVVTLLRLVQQGPAAAIQSTFGATVPAEWTLTRSTSGRARNSTGIWTNFSANTPRQHFIAPGISGLLIDGGVTAQHLYDSVDPGWTVTASTKTINTTAQTPTGTRSLTWRKDATEAEHKVGLTLTSANVDMPTGEFTLSIMLKPVGVQYWRLRVKGIDNVWLTCLYDLGGDGAVVSADTGTICQVEREPIMTDWYRISMDRSQTVTAGVAAEIELIPALSNLGGASTEGNTAHGMDLCHLQIEPGAGYSAPIVVTGATGKSTRAPDILRATGTWFQKANYALGIRFARLRDVPATQCLWQVRDTANAATNDLQALQVESGNLILRTRTGGVTLTPTTGGTVTRGVQATALMVVDSTSRIALFDQGAKRGEVSVGTGGVAAPVAPTVIRIGATEPNGTVAASVVLMAVYQWTTALSDTDAALFSGNLNYSPPPGPAALPVISIPANVSVREGQSIDIPITKTGAGSCSATFRTRARTGQAALGTDYIGVEQSVSFNSNDTTVVITVQTVADAVPDPNETLGIELNTPVNCTFGNATGTLTITELPVVSVPASATVIEGNAVTIPITKTGTGACSVSVITGQVTATVNVDYTGISATTISFGETENSKSITIQTTADTTTEPNERFNVTLSSPTNCTLGTEQCAVTIQDNDGSEPAPVTALPTPKGFGTSGDFGLAGAVYRVTTIEDTGTQGSLRHALLTAGTAGRLIVFEVGGIFKVTNRINVLKAYNVTVAGETAPSPGVTLQASGTWNGPLLVLYDVRNFNLSNVAMERPYADVFVNDTNYDGFGTEPRANERCENIWIDHCATFWSFDEAASMWHGSTWSDATSAQQNITISNTMFCEPLNRPDLNGGSNPHRKGGVAAEPGHNYGLLLGYRLKRTDIQHCLFTETKRRTPFLDVGAQAVLANNLALNCEKGPTAEHNARDGYQSLVTTVGYLIISGPNTEDTNISGFRIHGTYGTNHKFFASNLYSMKGTGATVTPKTEITVGNESYRSMIVTTRPIDCPTPVVAMTAQQIYDRAVLNVGPRPKERAIPSVAKAIAKLKNKTGKWVNLPSEVGGPSSLATKTRSLGAAGAGSSPGNFPDGSAIPAMPTAGNATTMRAWLRKFKDQVQYD